MNFVSFHNKLKILFKLMHSRNTKSDYFSISNNRQTDGSMFTLICV